ncbi:DUF4275 family protein [Bacillus sp. SM2101]|uniref:DUF4275 family protein n=1 Tax=Bacillus sp. SM2101 TaxID=2805366 RepID=UPI001BDEFBE3|nr:DUF4275 family protein [Bacillus sp. SM2101]
MNSNREQLHSIIQELTDDAVFELTFYAKEIKSRYEFKDKMDQKGVGLTYIGNAEVRKRWEDTFTNSISQSKKDEIFLHQYLWHIFSFQVLPCKEKEKAIEAFNTLKKNKIYVFYQNTYSYSLENAENITTEDFKGERDIYIVNEDFTWTYIQTHEQEAGLGPYFFEI